MLLCIIAIPLYTLKCTFELHTTDIMSAVFLAERAPSMHILF